MVASCDRWGDPGSTAPRFQGRGGLGQYAWELGQRRWRWRWVGKPRRQLGQWRRRVDQPRRQLGQRRRRRVGQSPRVVAGFIPATTRYLTSGYKCNGAG